MADDRVERGVPERQRRGVRLAPLDLPDGPLRPRVREHRLVEVGRDERPPPCEAPCETLRHDAGAARRLEHAHPGLHDEPRREILREPVKKHRPEVPVVVLGHRADERRVLIRHGS